MPPKKSFNITTTRSTTPQEFVRIVMSNPNQVLPECIENVIDVNTGELYAVRMEFGGWEITASGFKAIEIHGKGVA